jgi:hypothetical protein
VESPEQAELVQKFMLAIAPDVIRFTTHHVPASTWYSPSDQESTADQRRFLCVANARLTLELAVHLAAQAASVSHAAKEAPPAKDPAQDQIQASAQEPGTERKATT